MKKSTISDIGKKRIGRPPVGSAPTMVRLLPDQAAALDAWIKKQKEPELTRPEAIRRQLDLGLRGK